MRCIIFIVLFIIPAFIFAEETHEYQLPNGLKLIVREDRRAPVVLSSVWYKVGGSYEHSGITGISHMLEHEMFLGTQRYKKGMFDKIVSENGGIQNAMTSSDFTLYYQQLAVGKLPISFELEADRMRGLLLQKKAFNKEKMVVMEERRMRINDNPQSLTWERFKAAAHVNNPYHHPVIGWMTDIQHCTIDDLRKWYRTWYAPNNAIVIVVGDVHPEQVYQLAKKYFGPLKQEKIPRLHPRTEVVSLGIRQVDVNLPAQLPWLVMGYNTPVLPTSKNRWEIYALDVAAYLLGGGDSSRFAKNLVRGRQIAVGAATQYNPFQLHNDLFVFAGIPTAGYSINQLKRAFLGQIKKLQTTLVDTQELERTKAQMIAGNIYDKDSIMNQAINLGVPEAIGLSWREGDRFVDHIKSVTPQQIQAVARKYLVPNRLTIAILHPVAEGKRARLP